jgi:hypothetical protein
MAKYERGCLFMLKDLMAERICETPIQILVKMNTMLHFILFIFGEMGFTQGHTNYLGDLGK